MVEFLAHRGERTGLDLDQRRPSANVDNEPAELDFELVAGLGVELLQLSVERALVQRADMSDGTSLGRRQHVVGHPHSYLHSGTPLVDLADRAAIGGRLPRRAATADRDEHGQQHRSDDKNCDRAALRAIDRSQIRHHRRRAYSDHDRADNETEQ